MYNWNPFKDAHGWKPSNSWENFHRCWDRGASNAKVSLFHLQRIPWAAATVWQPSAHTHPKQMNSLLRDLWYNPKTWNSHDNKCGLYAECLNISQSTWRLNTVMKQDDTISKCTMMFVLGTLLLEYLILFALIVSLHHFKCRSRSFSVPLVLFGHIYHFQGVMQCHLN